MLNTSCETGDYQCRRNDKITKLGVDSLCNILNNKFAKAKERCHFKITKNNILEIRNEKGYIWYTNICNIDCQSFTYTIWSEEKATIGINIIDNAKKVNVKDDSGKIYVKNHYESLDFAVKPAKLFDEVKDPLCDLLCKIQTLKTDCEK
ncbi:MAG: hypothetical protein U5Q03_17960 [Bacteroidota bacterium]|nr:hypothetical protein [Bacteroidota bacterium]